VPGEDRQPSADPPPAARRRGNVASRVLLFVLTFWALAMIAPGLYRVIVPLAAFGFSADNSGLIRDVTGPFQTASESPAATAGLRPGDRIDLSRMRCEAPTSRACADLVTVLGGLGGLQYVLPGRTLDLAIQPAEGGPMRLVRLEAAPAPLGWPARLVLLAVTIVGIVFVLNACHLVLTRASAMTWGFFLYAIWFNPGQSYTYYAILQAWPVAVIVQQIAEAFAQGAAYAGLLVFAVRFPTNMLEPRWRWVERAAPWIGVVIAAMMLLSAANLFGVPTERVAQAAFLSGYAVDASVIVVLLLRRRDLHPQDEARMRWAIAGCAIGLPAFIFAEICQSSALLYDLWGTSPSQTAVGLLYLLQGVIAYFVGTAIRRRRVVSVVIPLRRGTVLTALALCLGVPVLYLHELAASYQENLHLPEWIWPLVVGPVVLIVGQRLHEIAVDLVDRAFNRHFHRARERLVHSASVMLRAHDLNAIDRLLVEEPVRVLRLASAAVFRWAEGGLRRVEPAIGWERDGVLELRSDLDAPALLSLARGMPECLPRGGWRRPGLPGDDRAPCLAVPVCGGAREGVAVALYGPHVTGSDIDPDERDMLREFATRAAIAYDRVETELLRAEVRALRAQLAARGAPAVGGALQGDG
jgi:hypothetical protein